MMQFNGIKVVIVRPCVEEIMVKRSWKERLLTLPLKPFSKYKKESFLQEQIADGEIVMGANCAMMNEKTWENLNLSVNAHI